MNRDKKLKVLIADDEKSNLDVLIHILKDIYTIYPVKCGLSVMKKAADINPDLIILDIVMPDINGFDVIKQLKNDEATEHIPVIFITSLGSAEDEMHGLSLGAADYIIKPFNNEIVKERVRKHIEISALLRAKDEQGVFDETTALPNRKSFDHQLLIEWGRAIREQKPVSLIMIEIDGFASYKDNHGRERSNLLLRQTASALKQSLKRTTDIIARYSEGVFGVILPSTPNEGAAIVKEVINGNLQGIPVCFNIGFSTALPKKGDDVSVFVLQADRSLNDYKGA